MKLIDYVKDAFKDGPELWSDEKYITNAKGVTIKRDVKRLRDMSLGLVSSSNAEEWYRICRLSCPAGTIIEPCDDMWVELFNDNVALVRNELTKMLLRERANKSAKTLFDILERRDRVHWAKDETKTATATINKETNDIVVKFEVKE